MERTRTAGRGPFLPPRDGDVWRIDCSRFEQVDKAGQPPSLGLAGLGTAMDTINSTFPKYFLTSRFLHKYAEKRWMAGQAK